MKRFIDYIWAGILLAPAWASAATIDPNDPRAQACTGAGGTFANGVCTGSNKSLDLGTAFKTIANTLIFLVGAISILMVIIGGLRYVLSGGDAAGVKSAKDTILYAIIGVVVAIVAYSLVNFVISAFK